jgi:hypothetical protein
LYLKKTAFGKFELSNKKLNPVFSKKSQKFLNSPLIMAVSATRARKMRKSKRENPCLVCLSTEAKKLWTDFFDQTGASAFVPQGRDDA